MIAGLEVEMNKAETLTVMQKAEQFFKKHNAGLAYLGMGSVHNYRNRISLINPSFSCIFYS